MSTEAEVVSLPKRVLVADDEHLMARGLATQLERLGLAVVGPVADGDQAIEIAGRDQPDLALLDIRMPRKSGLEAAAVLWTGSGIPTVIVSAFCDDEYLGEAQQTGVFGFLIKPVGEDDLRAALSVAWARARGDGEKTCRIAQLERTLEARKLVEKAKWRLIELRGISESEAHTTLQRRARNERRPIAEIAAEVLCEE